MFIGEYQHSIDIKKRLSLPAKFRKELGKKVVITRGFENCLVVYTQEQWKGVMEELKNLPTGRAETRKFTRAILGGATEVSLDKLGRILIPDYLKNYAQLKKNVIIAGVYNRLEVWDKSRWDMFKQQSEKEVDNMAERLGELGV